MGAGHAHRLYRHGHSPVHGLPPHTKLAATFAFVVVVVSTPREAMWAYLWVEVVYNQDKEEVAKALARLAEVFKQLGDEDRERAYHDRMRRNRALLL